MAQLTCPVFDKDEETRKTVERFRSGIYRNMADVAEELRAVFSS